MRLDETNGKADDESNGSSSEQEQVADPKRLEALRSAVESGKYRISADELARAILDAHTKS
jgi:anti-sigma28 factor (negative regulator of flagellin synthesis)